jgi:hypothetical protein
MLLEALPFRSSVLHRSSCEYRSFDAKRQYRGILSEMKALHSICFMPYELGLSVRGDASRSQFYNQRRAETLKITLPERNIPGWNHDIYSRLPELRWGRKAAGIAPTTMRRRPRSIR